MKEKPLHILIIGYTWPEPRSSAAGMRMMQLIRLFKSTRWKVSFYSPAQRRTHAEDLDDLGIITGSIKANTEETDGFFKEHQPDVVVFDRFMMEEQFGWRVVKECPNAVRILDTEDLHFLRKARQKAVTEDRKLTEEDLFSETAKREIAAILRCDLSLIISEFEMDLLQSKFDIPKALITYLPFIWETSKFGTLKSTPFFEERSDFFFIGNYFHAPNYDAVKVLKGEIWPVLRKKCSEAKLFIYGAYTEQKVRQLENKQERFIVRGRTENLAETFQKHRLLLAPLRYGAGLKGKIVDGMFYGTPSITTPMGAEGISGNLPFCGSIENTHADFIEAAQHLYTTQSDWQRAQENGRKILEQRFDQSFFGTALLKKIEEIAIEINVHRLQNFNGQILMHHRLQSTKYLSRWITAKNKLMNKED